MKYLKLSVEEEKKRDERLDDAGMYGCCICGKAIKEGAEKRMLHWLPNGAFVDDEDSPIQVEPGADIGYWEVGAVCYRKFLRIAEEKTKEEIEQVMYN